MNTALFASAFYPHIGGVEEWCVSWQSKQKKQGDHRLS